MFFRQRLIKSGCRTGKFIQAMEDDQRTYEELTAVLMEGYLKELLEQGRSGEGRPQQGRKARH